MRARNGEPQAFFDEAGQRDTDECILWPFSSSRGYGTIWTRREGTRRGALVHDLACAHAHGDRPTAAHQSAHSCHTPRCFNPRHLSWKTPTENAADRLTDGTDNRGERHHHARLTEGDVVEIRRRLSAGEKHRVIAAEYGVVRTTITQIGLRNRWGWL